MSVVSILGTCKFTQSSNMGSLAWPDHFFVFKVGFYGRVTRPFFPPTAVWPREGYTPPVC